jgi:hypothetical protein
VTENVAFLPSAATGSIQMRSRRLLSVSCLAVINLVSHEGLASTVSVGNTTLSFDAGPSLCALTKTESEFDRLMLEWQEKANAGTNRVLGIYLDCDRLERLRQGKEVDIGQYGILLAVHGGMPAPEPLVGYSREQFITEMSRHLKKGVPLSERELGDRLHSALDPDLQAGIGSLKIGDVRQLGELAKDEAGVYSGLLMKVQTKFYSEIISGVSGLSLIKGYPIQYSAYRPFVDKSSFHIMLDHVQTVMRNTVLSNESFEARVSGLPTIQNASSVTWGIDWAAVATKGLVGGAVGVVVAGVFAAVRLVRRRNARE